MTNKERLQRIYFLLDAAMGPVDYDERLELTSAAFELVKEVDTGEEIIEHDPTREESEILESFDEEFMNMMNRYVLWNDGLRPEVLRNAAIADADVWFDDYINQVNEEEDEEDDE